ncbi:hypothetical protein D3C72_2186530 [compost metagenome]
MTNAVAELARNDRSHYQVLRFRRDGCQRLICIIGQAIATEACLANAGNDGRYQSVFPSASNNCSEWFLDIKRSWRLANAFTIASLNQCRADQRVTVGFSDRLQRLCQ